MKNTVIWGYHHEGAYPAITSLEERGLINIIAWIGDKRKCPYCTEEIRDFSNGIFKATGFSNYDYKVYEEVYHSLFNFTDMYFRRFRDSDKTLYEMLNKFNVLFNYFFDLLSSKNVELVLFANLPHVGADLILYEVARKLGIKTVLCYQSLFPNKFFYVFDTPDFGDFNNVLPFDLQATISLEKKHKKDLFYMKKVKKNKIAPYLKSFSKWKKLGIKIRAWFGQDLLKLAMLTGLKYKRHQEYKSYLKNNCIKVDMNEKFVYFPLHLQPELTTAALGGIYADQILAIERLVALIPDSWYIYVKENPKQTSFVRGPWFFERLKLIKNVRLVAPAVDTYALLQNCQFVATITGTAGWEAVSGGKNVLIFGQAWYKKLPGVFSYSETVDVNALMQYKINHKELEQKLNVLMAKLGTGVMDEAYKVMLEDYNPEKNTKYIEQFLEKIIAGTLEK